MFGRVAVGVCDFIGCSIPAACQELHLAQFENQNFRTFWFILQHDGDEGDPVKI